MIEKDNFLLNLEKKTTAAMSGVHSPLASNSCIDEAIGMDMTSLVLHVFIQSDAVLNTCNNGLKVRMKRFIVKTATCLNGDKRHGHNGDKQNRRNPKRRQAVISYMHTTHNYNA